jgi:hypothetical protein
MKVFRWAAVVVVTLMSLMNLGAGSGSGIAVAVIVIGIAVGVAGLVAVYGLVRKLGWGVPAALGVSAVNLVLGIIGVAAGWDGAPIGIVVSVVGLVLILLSSPNALGRSRSASTV